MQLWPLFNRGCVSCASAECDPQRKASGCSSGLFSIEAASLVLQQNVIHDRRPQGAALAFCSIEAASLVLHQNVIDSGWPRVKL